MEKLKNELGDRIIIFKCDVTDEMQVKYAIEETVKHFGHISVAFGCAGVAAKNPLLSDKGKPLDTKAFRKVMDINLMGNVYLAKYSSIEMAKNKLVGESEERGVIIFVSSIAAEDGWKGVAPYSASKAALNGMLMPMARDLGRYGIRVVNIAPGFFFTPFTEDTPEAGLKMIRSMTPQNRFGDNPEFAHLAQTIVENSYLNGVRLRIDGGMRVGNV
jgi:NAD(P)-dependent dehydrogenase (short-subunit alcohol dehydrogenase family)